MLLYASTNSGRSYKARSFLLMAGIAHTYWWIDLKTPRPDRPAEFLAASKFGEVPVLIDQDDVLCQSNAILIRLAQRSGHFAGEGNEWQSVL